MSFLFEIINELTREDLASRQQLQKSLAWLSGWCLRPSDESDISYSNAAADIEIRTGLASPSLFAA